MKKTLVSFAAVSLMSVAGFASAAEPMHLTELQMDTVAAGTNNNGNNGPSKVVVSSLAGGGAVAGLGYAGSYSKSKAEGFGVTTYASNKSKAFGLLVGAKSEAGSQIKIKF